MRSFITSILLFYAALCRSQGRPELHFTPYAGGRPLVLQQPFCLNGGDSISVSAFRCYIGQVCLVRKGKTVALLSNSYHLIDAGIPESTIIAGSLPAGVSYDAIRFNLGVDSLTNAAGAQGGDLDATKGMYWAWHSGYINFKLEGVSPRCTTRRHEFAYHLGGFRGAAYCMQVITLPVAQTGNKVTIRIDLDRFLAAADPGKEPQVMSPGPAAVALSVLAATIFQPQVTGQ